jgi:hypothetical protein
MGRKESVEDSHERRVQVVSLAGLPPCRLVSRCKFGIANLYISLMNTVLDVVKNGGTLEAAQAEVDTKVLQWFEGRFQIPGSVKSIAGGGGSSTLTRQQRHKSPTLRTKSERR